MTDVRTSSATAMPLRAKLRKALSASLFMAIIATVVTGSFQPKYAHAAAGQGTATIRTAVSSGSDNASTATYGSPSGSATFTVGAKTYARVDFTVGASGIAGAQNNFTMQVNTNLFPTNSWGTSLSAALTDLDTVGEWFVSYVDTDAGTTDNTAISFAASAAVNTGLITIQANQQMDSTDILRIFFVVNDNNYVRDAANLVISVDDTGANSLTFISAPITVATTAAALTSTNVAPASTTVGTTGTATVSFTIVTSIAANGKIKVTFPSGFTLTNVASSDVDCSTMDGSFAAGVAGQIVTITRSGGTIETAGAQTCTIAHVINPVVAGSTGTYTIITTDGSNNVQETDAAVTADTMFAASGTSNGTATATPVTYGMSVTAPEATSAYDAGDDIVITWSTASGTGAISAVNLDYSTDGGITYSSIVTGTANDGSYTWTAPDIAAQSITVRAQGTDLMTVLATDTSDAFSIGTDGTDTTTPPAEEVDTDSGSSELLPTGTFMKGASWTTVYYIDGTTRRPFLDSQTFFTYADNFDSIIDVADDYLANYTIGAPMLPKAGVVLVKIQSVNSVYALEADNTLRWITSESIAKSLYGARWADYVIDVPVTAWGHFNHGDDVTSVNDITVDTSSMQTRNALNSK